MSKHNTGLEQLSQPLITKKGQAQIILGVESNLDFINIPLLFHKIYIYGIIHYTRATNVNIE